MSGVLIMMCEEKIYVKDKVTILYCECSLGIYIINIKSENQQEGKGTKVLKEFIENKSTDIYLYAIGEFNISTEKLVNWYEKLGFIKTNIIIPDIPYKCSHVLYNN